MVLNCAICSDVLSVEKEGKVTPCGHLFHSECILQWIALGHNSCPNCREPVLVNNLIHIYPTYAEENDTQLRNLNAENQKLKDDLNKMTEYNHELNKNLELKLSSIESLEVQLKKLGLEKQELQLKLTSMDNCSKTLLYENNELEMNLGSALSENDQNDIKIKKYEEEFKLMTENVLSLNSELDKKDNELSSSYDQIERLNCIKESLILQNINYKRKTSLNKCDICKELISEIN